MTAMFVANATQQVHILAYRLPEMPNAIEQHIPPGGQVMLRARRGDLSPKDIEVILDQYEPYGMIKVDAVGRGAALNGLVYSLDKPVPMPRLLAQIDHNRQVMIRAGKSSRQAAAVAANDRINERLSEITGQDVMQKLTVEVEQHSRPRVVNEGYGTAELARQLAESDTVAEGIRIGDEPLPPAAPARRARRARSR